MLTQRVRFTWLDAVLAAALAGFVCWFVWRVHAGLDYQWRWNVLAKYLVRHEETSDRWVMGLILDGLFTTLKLSLWSMLFATLIGTVMGLARSGRRLFPRMVGRTYVELVRNTPPLVLIYIIYFFLADQIMAALHVDQALRALPDGLQSVLAVVAAPVSRMPNFLSALMTMAIYEGAFITEHVRAGVQSVERGQREASYALGLSPWQEMRHVVLPQALSRIVPPLAGQFISTIKDTAILSVISVQELTFQSLELLASTAMTYETMITLTALYLCLTLTCSLLARKLELRLRRAWT